jgi:hypothetical protein
MDGRLLVTCIDDLHAVIDTGIKNVSDMPTRKPENAIYLLFF